MADKEKIKSDLDKSPNNYGYQEEFWSLKILKDFLFKRYQLRYKSDQSYYDLLKYAGYSYQRPLKKDRPKRPLLWLKDLIKNIKKTQKNIKIRLYG